jgi:hypothetical protein
VKLNFLNITHTHDKSTVVVLGHAAVLNYPLHVAAVLLALDNLVQLLLVLDHHNIGLAIAQYDLILLGRVSRVNATANATLETNIFIRKHNQVCCCFFIFFSGFLPGKNRAKLCYEPLRRVESHNHNAFAYFNSQLK